MLQVNYVGKAGNLYEDAGYELHGSSYVIDKFLGTSWLWDRVRVVGGAYGGFCNLDTHSGMVFKAKISVAVFCYKGGAMCINFKNLPTQVCLAT